MSGPNLDLQVPFDGHGNQLTYARYYPGDDYVETSTRWTDPRKNDVLWRFNDPFDAVLLLDRTERGRSAAHFIWKQVPGYGDGLERTMFLADLAALIKSGVTISDGRVTGRWAYRKRGQNYGVYLVVP